MCNRLTVDKIRAAACGCGGGRPRVRTVANKVDAISSTFRALPLELIAGEANFNVRVQHGAAQLRFDYSKVYWSSRLHTEHARMAGSFRHGELVWDLFCGVGPFAVLAAQRGVRVLANDLNPHACSVRSRRPTRSASHHVDHSRRHSPRHHSARTRAPLPPRRCIRRPFSVGALCMRVLDAQALVENVHANRVADSVCVYQGDAAEFVRRATAVIAGAAEAAGNADDDGNETPSDAADSLDALRLHPAAPSPTEQLTAPRAALDQKATSYAVKRVTKAATGTREGAPPEAEAARLLAAASASEATLPAHILLNLPADSLRFLRPLRALGEVLRPQPVGGSDSDGGLTYGSGAAGGRIVADAPVDTDGAFDGAPMVHCYSFSTLPVAAVDDQLREARERVSAELVWLPTQLTVRTVRNVAPGKHMLCYSFCLRRDS